MRLCPATIEACARVADQLGGVRERLPLREGNDAEARYQQTNRAQHVRAASIAKAIRLLASDSEERRQAETPLGGSGPQDRPNDSRSEIAQTEHPTAPTGEREGE
jgi:hypothetical protein